MKRTALLLLCALLAFAVGNLCYAGGPLQVSGPAAAQPGQPYVWDTASFPVRYTIDSGPLSATPEGVTVINNQTGVAGVAAMFHTWQSVPTTSISYTSAGPITGVAGGDVKTINDFNAVQASCNSAAQNPVIFDADGSIFSALGFDSLTIGISGICSANPATGKIQSAFLMLNGELQDGVTDPTTSNYELAEDLFEEGITHEIGHFSGLGHSQINVEVLNQNPLNCNLDDLAGLPLMFPEIICQSRSSENLPLLAPDDMAWISKLYPNASYAANYGTIRGYIYFPDGVTQLQGLNVIARAMDNPATTQDESKRTAVSAVSGFLFTGNPGQSISGTNTGGDSNGGRDPNLIGYYEIPVPPGTYNIQVEDINSSFASGSLVGPLDPPILVLYPGEFWHQYESSSDLTQQKDPIVVQAGQTVSNINVIMNGNDPRFDNNEDDGHSLVTNLTNWITDAICAVCAWSSSL
ncbi:MAG TPA: hypothetical protein VN862_09490 [Candidatus Acidoferrales bacterium]|nr:hypothetical protein [Candidatus Acidoferrales bacterium]